MNTENIGKLIRELRKEKGWTQKELASKLHVTDKAVSKWERGKSMPDSSIMQDICEKLGINITELLSGERGNPEIGFAESVNLVMELADFEKERKAKQLNCYFFMGLLLLMFVLLHDYFLLYGFLKEPWLGKIELGLFIGLGIAFEIAGLYYNNRNSKSSSFTSEELEVLMKNEKDLKMKTSEEMLQFAKKYQKAEFKQYRLAFDEIVKGLNEDEYAVFSMVGEDYVINESICMNYPALAVTSSRVLIGGETIRGRLLTRYIMDAYELSEIHSVKIVNHKIVLKTSNGEIKIEGKNLESVVEKLKEILSKKS